MTGESYFGKGYAAGVAQREKYAGMEASIRFMYVDARCKARAFRGSVLRDYMLGFARAVSA